MISIASQKQILHFFKNAYSLRARKYYGFYNSQFNKIILDEHLMLIPIDDRTATRGHGVFDVAYVKNKKIINLDSHLDRLYRSAESVSIIPPFQKEKAKQVIIDVVSKVVSHYLKTQKEVKAIENVFGVRMTISSGYGDLGISNLTKVNGVIQNKESILYLILFEPYINYEIEKNGVNEFVVKYVKQPKSLVHSKTIDYTQNAIMANQSMRRGGYQGIKAFENGVLLEAAMANVAFIFGKEFATPRLQTVIEGTTLKKLLKFVQKLKQDGIIQKISFRDIHVSQAEKADEMIVIGGDKIIPVLNFNDHPISKGKGRFTEMFQGWYEQTNQKGYEIKINLTE